MIDALDIRVRGIVQGVGFRPFVYKLAKRYVVSGWVLNDREGVFIHAEAQSNLLDSFVLELSEHAPAAAHVSEIELTEVPLQECTSFEIRQSAADESADSTLVSADLAICDDCLRELFDPKNKRYRYPFINCTNCGPRFTIIDELPYDRPTTSMAVFPMCPDCRAEYENPEDRRFHAQPNACWECGPSVSFVPSTDAFVYPYTDNADEVFAQAVDLLAQGGILAVKGLGGYHLACDAHNEQAIATLRTRKQRDGKPFAIMAASVQAAQQVCFVDADEQTALTSPARPIVLLRKKPGAVLARGLADALPEVGIMLPATPVHYLLLHDFTQATGRQFLVMTSGNSHDDPIAIDDADAQKRLAGIADAFLANNRDIRSRYDDSVLRIVHAGETSLTQMIRRARGFAPVPLSLTCDSAHSAQAQPAICAVGAEQKATFSLVASGKAFVSQHIGDVEDADTFDAWMDAKHTYEKLFQIEPRMLACDLHPEYLTSKWAREEARLHDYALVEVQHHHAHIASVLGEHNVDGPACGIAFDGTGYGADGALWGGEVLLANRSDYERFANIAYMPMPGGVAAINEPLRMAYGALWAFDLLNHAGATDALDALGADQAALCETLIERGLNTPYTSSVGRLFDAASALIGCCRYPTYQGEAAVLLDAAAQAYLRDAGNDSTEDVFADAYAFDVVKNVASKTSTAHDTSVVLFDAAPVFASLLDDVEQGVDKGLIALRFHGAIVSSVVQAAQLVRAVYDVSLVVLSGGVFMNRLVVEQSIARLQAMGFTVAVNADLPPNDGCISYGQAVVAAAYNA